MSKIAFLGLGAMGSRIARRLVDSSHDVTVWNRTAAVATAFATNGSKAAATPAEAVAEADFVFSMVTDDDAAREVWLRPGTGALTGLKAGAVAIESSTVTPAWIRELSAGLAVAGVPLLDAPVAGSRPQAEAGQLVFMVGGPTEALEAVRPVLTQLSNGVVHVGAVGQGAVLKLAVNALFAAQLHSIAELLGFLSRNGFASEQAAELLGKFPIVAPPLAGAAKMIAARSTTPLFTIDLLEKDLGYILTAAAASDADLPGAQLTRTLLQQAQIRGLGQSNISGLAALFA